MGHISLELNLCYLNFRYAQISKGRNPARIPGAAALIPSRSLKSGRGDGIRTGAAVPVEALAKGQGKGGELALGQSYNWWSTWCWIAAQREEGWLSHTRGQPNVHASPGVHLTALRFRQRNLWNKLHIKWRGGGKREPGGKAWKVFQVRVL